MSRNKINNFSSLKLPKINVSKLIDPGINRNYNA